MTDAEIIAIAVNHYGTQATAQEFAFARAILAAQGNLIPPNSTELESPITQPLIAKAARDDAALDSALYDAMAEQLGDLYYCGRTWSAWSVGTMSGNDFSIASEDDDIVTNFVHAARAAIAAVKRDDVAGDAKQSLTDNQIESGWHQTFSTSNPYCPCNLKSFTKAVRWTLAAIAASTKEAQ